MNVTVLPKASPQVMVCKLGKLLLHPAAPESKHYSWRINDYLFFSKAVGLL